jgi:hypothetical protein
MTSKVISGSSTANSCNSGVRHDQNSLFPYASAVNSRAIGVFLTRPSDILRHAFNLTSSCSFSPPQATNHIRHLITTRNYSNNLAPIHFLKGPRPWLDFSEAPRDIALTSALLNPEVQRVRRSAPKTRQLRQLAPDMMHTWRNRRFALSLAKTDSGGCVIATTGCSYARCADRRQ